MSESANGSQPEPSEPDQSGRVTGRVRDSRILLLMGEATGGISGHVASLATDLAAVGTNVRVATTAASVAALPAGTDNVVALWPGRGGSVRGLRSALAGADLVHAHGHQAGVLAVLLRATLPRWRPRPAIVITWHNALLAGGWRARVGRLLEAVQVRGADLLTGASRDLVERARTLGARRTDLSLVAAPDLEAWPGQASTARAELAAELGLPPQAPWVLTISRISAQKNLPVLVDAARRLGGEAVWVVVGAGDRELERQLRSQIEATGAKVRLVGTRRDIPRLIAASDLLALPSEWEARSLVVQEALVGGLPCVVSDAGGLPDLVGEAGLLVPVGDAEALADAVDRVLTEPGLADELRRRGLAQGAALPRADSVRAYWLGRYDRLLAERGRADQLR